MDIINVFAGVLIKLAGCLLVIAGALTWVGMKVSR